MSFSDVLDRCVAVFLGAFVLNRHFRTPEDKLDVRPEPPVPGLEWRAGAFVVKTVEQVQAVINVARAKGRRVRVAGARHSAQDAVFSPTHDDVRLVLDGALRTVEFEEADSKRALVVAGGGCNLGVNPSDPSSNRGNSFNHIIDARGYALPVLGGISHQTIGGFLQTSSAGGSLKHGFADAIRWIELVDGTGQLRRFERGSDEFNAAGVAMGLFGVVTRVGLTVEPRYFVKGMEVNQDHSQSLLRRDAGGDYALRAALGSNDYLHLNWFPQQRVHRVTHWSGRRCNPITNPDPYESELRKKWTNVLAAAVLFLTSGLLALDPDNSLVQKIVGSLLCRFVPLDRKETFNDSWLAVLPCDDQARVDSLVKVVFTEVWLPLDQLTNALDRLNRLVDDPAVASNIVIELYGARTSPFWLSPSFDRDVVRVDIFWWAHNVGNARRHFVPFWNVLLEVSGARLHWGKHLPDVGAKYGSVTFDPTFLRDRYPRLDDWLRIRQRFDPDGVFLSDYWARILGV